jgi:Flp pilus assembly protein TadB
MQGDLLAFAVVFAAASGVAWLLEATVGTPLLFAVVLAGTYVGARLALPRLDRRRAGRPGRTLWPSTFWAGFSGLALAFAIFEVVR